MSDAVAIKSGDSFWLRFEKWSPVGVGVISFVAIAFFSRDVTNHFGSGDWNLSNLYGAVFNWAALQTGLLFGVYGFVVSKDTGFIGEIRNSVFMQRFVSYIWRAVIIGFILTFSSIPLIVANPSIKVGQLTSFLVVNVWFSLFVWAFLAFVRVAYIFGIVARVRDKEFIPG